MDDLEKYIRDNSALWDEHKAPNELWQKITTVLDEPHPNNKSVIVPKWMLWTLLLIAIALIGYLLLPANHSSPSQNTAPQYALQEEFLEAEQYYHSTINQQFIELQQFTFDATLLDDLSQLDRTEKQLKTELSSAQGIFKERIIQALILNNQIKLGLLQRVLTELKKDNTHDHTIL